VFDSTGTFSRQFVPTEGGYIYYPSKKSGGKLITNEEYQELTEGWRQVAGRSGIWKIVGVTVLAIVVWAFISKTLSLPHWSDSASTIIIVTGISFWLLWASLAPRRLVKDRPDVFPPRPVSEVRRQTRALLNWRFIIFALLFSGVAFFGSLNATERNFTSWAWLCGSGIMFGLYIWIAIQKFRER
jgi:hypothetical protein